ncbi:MAG TPA: FAD-dependent oxidoreductase [Hyphomicrobiaceae bacterium]|nr:FAD-dependent oxidoreductase [Hyphomicrobiaceae bacterium]
MQKPSEQAAQRMGLDAPSGGTTARSAERVPPAPAQSPRELNPDLCVIGGGAGGLSVAAAAAQLGVSVVLIEKHKMGGDCLNYGCVPSKALLAAAGRAHAMRTAAPFGIAPARPAIDHAAVNDHVRAVIAAIAPNDSVERFTGLNVKVVSAPARFIDRKRVLAGEWRIKARRFVIATGSSPEIPGIPGLAEVAYFTNETIFANRAKLEHLIVVGAGPIGLELAQAHLRLGSHVTVLEALKALGNEDPELSQLVLERLQGEGMDIREGVGIERIAGANGAIEVAITEAGVSGIVRGTHLLLATGRSPNVSGLNLEAARVKYDRAGIKVNGALKTSNRRVYAIGDVTGGPQFTHIANYHADIVVRRALFRLPAKVDGNILPSTIFTDPELAHVGVSEEAARRRYGRIRVLRWPFHENDKAQTERATDGFVKVITDAKGRIVGAGVVGRLAGEVIQMWCLAVSQGLGINAMTRWISPYPALCEVNKRVAYGYYASAAASPFVRKLIGWLARLG